MQIVLCRHTQTDHNKNGIYSGHFDIGLNATGLQQAKLLARRIGSLDGPVVGAVFSSDLIRAATLAEVIGKRIGVIPVLTPKLREVNIGKMTGMNRELAMTRFPAERHRTAFREFDFRDIGGESARQVIERHEEFLTSAVHAQAQRIVVVGHGTALRLLFCYMRRQITQLHDQGNFQLVEW